MSTRNSQTSMTYDPTTGTWSPSPSGNISTPTGGLGSTPSLDPSLESLMSGLTVPDSLTYDTSDLYDAVDSQSEADKIYIEIEFNTLNGDLILTATTKSIRIKVNDTIRLEGIGLYLSGQYFVSAVRRVIDNSGGYSHSFTLIRNGFGESLKNPKAVSEALEAIRKQEVAKSAPGLSIGDHVRIVGNDAIYSNYHDGVKVPEWVKKKTLVVQKFSSDNTRVYLSPINSWTYVRYIQKV